MGSNLSVTLPALSATLLDAYDNYTTARPCMTSLLTRQQDINTTAIVLPSDIDVRPSAGTSCLYLKHTSPVLLFKACLREPPALLHAMSNTNQRMGCVQMQSAYQQLQSAQQTLDDVLINGTQSPVLLAASLNQAASQISSQPISNSINAALTTSQASCS